MSLSGAACTRLREPAALIGAETVRSPVIRSGAQTATPSARRENRDSVDERPHNAPVHPKLTTATGAGFAAGQIAGQLFRDAPSLLLLFFLTNVIGIEAAWAGLAIFIPKVLFGALADLSVGLASDKIVGSFPRRRWMLVGAVTAPIAMISLFTVPAGSVALQLGYIFIVFSFYMAVFATFSVPYLAQFSEITDDPGERTVLMAWRHAFTGVGILIGSAGLPLLIHTLGGGRGAYVSAAAVLAAICSLSLLIAYAAAASIRVTVPASIGLTLRSLVNVLRYKPFLSLSLAAVAQTVSAGMSYASLAYFMTYNLARPDAFKQIGIISTIMAVVVIAGSPIWVFVSRRFGKKNTYLFAAIGHALVQAIWGLSPGVPMPVIYGYAALIGLLNAGWGLISLSMLSDMIAASRSETGVDRAGAFSAIWSIIEKAGIALGGTLLTGAILSAAHFSATDAVRGIAQPASALQGIVFAYAFGPGLLKLLAVAIVWKYIKSDTGRLR